MIRFNKVKPFQTEESIVTYIDDVFSNGQNIWALLNEFVTSPNMFRFLDENINKNKTVFEFDLLVFKSIKCRYNNFHFAI